MLPVLLYYLFASVYRVFIWTLLPETGTQPKYFSNKVYSDYTILLFIYKNAWFKKTQNTLINVAYIFRKYIIRHDFYRRMNHRFLYNNKQKLINSSIIWQIYKYLSLIWYNWWTYYLNQYHTPKIFTHKLLILPMKLNNKTVPYNHIQIQIYDKYYPGKDNDILCLMLPLKWSGGERG